MRFHSVTLEEPGPVGCCAIPDVSMKCTAFIFRILMTKSVPSFQMSGRNIATIRRGNPKDLVPHYKNMFLCLIKSFSFVSQRLEHQGSHMTKVQRSLYFPNFVAFYKSCKKCGCGYHCITSTRGIETLWKRPCLEQTALPTLTYTQTFIKQWRRVAANFPHP